MKKCILLSICLLFGGSSISFAQNNIAVVNKIQGFYIFTDSQPLADYDAVGEVTTTGNEDRDVIQSGGQYQPARDLLIRLARQYNYTADGLILTFVNGGADKGIIIKFKDNQQNKNQAKVMQYQGCYIFTDSEPLNEANYIGSVTANLFSSQYTSVRDHFIKKSKKKFPDGKGLIIKLVSGSTDSADAIKFNN
jgi:hypothetical protein